MNVELLKRLDLLAGKLGVTVQYLWGVMVKQGHVQAWQNAIELLVCLGVLILISLRYTRWFSGCQDDEEPFRFICAIATIVGAGVLVCIVIYNICEFPTLIFNPEYFALQKIVEIIK